MKEAVSTVNNNISTLFRDKERQKQLIRTIIPFVGLLFIIVFFQIITKGRLLTPKSLKTIFNQGFTILLGACGISFVISQGNLDFSIGSISGMAAALTAISSGLGLIPSFIIAMITGFIIGSINGIAYVVFKAPANIVTLCTQFTFRGVIQVLCINSLAIPMGWSWLDNIGAKIIVAVIVMIITIVTFEYTTVGKYSRAAGSNSRAAVQSGVPLSRTQLTAFIISGVMAGVCGFFVTIRSGSVAPTTGISFEMDVLLAVVLGGMPLSGGSGAKIRSAIIGSAMIAFLMYGLVIWGINDNIQQGVKGVIFLIAAALSFERNSNTVIK